MSDESIASVVREVVWRFHVYGTYGGEPQKALKALARRAPGHSPEALRAMFEQSLAVLRATIAAVNAAPKTMKPGQVYCEPGDVDAEYVARRLRDDFPDVPDTLLESHLGMTIFWFYLK